MSSNVERRPFGPPRPLVLLADNEVETRAINAYILTAMGFNVMIATDGARLHAQASEARPDIIVLDLAMQGAESWTLLRSLKTGVRTRGIPVVVLSAHAAPSARERAFREGCDAFYARPCPPDALAFGLRSVLERATADSPGVADGR